VRESDTQKAPFYQVTPGYFQTVRTRLLGGRDFDERDRAGARRVAVVNETFARSIPKDASAVGSRFRSTPYGEWTNAPAVSSRFRLSPDLSRGLSREDEWIEVVGVVESGKHISLSTGPIIAVYVPREQVYSPGATVALRSNLRQGEALGLIRRTVAAIDPAVTLYDAGSLTDHLSLQALPGRRPQGL